MRAKPSHQPKDDEREQTGAECPVGNLPIDREIDCLPKVPRERLSQRSVVAQQVMKLGRDQQQTDAGAVGDDD